MGDLSPEMVRYLSAALGTVLMLAGAMKLSDGGAFARYLGDQGIPPRLSPVVPVAEGALGLLLLAGVFLAVVVPAATVLALAFVVVQLRDLARGGGRGGCRCFGALDRGTGAAVPLLRAGAVLAAATCLTLGIGGDAPSAALGTGHTDATVVGAASGAALVMGLSVLSRTRRFEQWRRTSGAAA
jgi:hypothetical protein